MSFRSNNTRLSQTQLISSRILGLLGIIVAGLIAYKQLKISEKQVKISEDQIELSDKQMGLGIWQVRLEGLRYSIDSLISNEDNLRRQISEIKIKIKENIGDKTALNTQLIEKKESLINNQRLIQESMKEYNRIYSDNDYGIIVKKRNESIES